jgi:hypothetical protein
MKPAPLALALAILTAPMVIGAPPARAVLLTTDPHVYMVSPNHRIRLEFPIGQLKVVPTDEPHVRFDIRVRCDGRSEESCEELANRLILDSDDTGGTLHLKLHKFSNWHHHGMKVMGELLVPRALAVDIEMGVGELDIRGMEGDIDVELGVGEADIQASKTQANYVSVDSGIGDAEIRGGGGGTRVRSFIGSHAEWNDHDGRSTVHLHVGVGDATVRLE